MSRSPRTAAGLAVTLLAVVLAAPSGPAVSTPASASPTTSMPAAAQDDLLGRIDFPTSGSAEAQQEFLRGVLLLHNFEYEDAAMAFQEAQALDPDFAMAYWGEAMTHNHPLWFQQDREAALEILDRLAPTAGERLAAAPTHKEKDWLRAVHVLYGAGEGAASADVAGSGGGAGASAAGGEAGGEGADDKRQRDFAYNDHMRRMHDRWPHDHEVAAFYALSILGTAHEGRDFRTYMRAAAVVQRVFDDNPRHPGAAHYLIHSFDDPVHAPLGLPAARAYSEIAPAAAHAQHMTSHIFVAMGMWDDVVAANQVARDVQDAREAELGRPPVRCGHYSSWLQYGYLQQGRFDAAERLMDLCHEQFVGDPENTSAGYFTSMRARYILDTGHWDAAGRWQADLEEAPRPAVLDGFADAFAALQRGDAGPARAFVERHADLPEDATEARILRLELEGLLELADGQSEAAIEKLRRATGMEAAMPYQFGPPAVAKPSHELLGGVFLDLGRHQEARESFEDALARAPRRTASLLGVLRAAKALGDEATVAEMRAELEEIWKHADEDAVPTTLLER